MNVISWSSRSYQAMSPGLRKHNQRLFSSEKYQAFRKRNYGHPDQWIRASLPQGRIQHFHSRGRQQRPEPSPAHKDPYLEPLKPARNHSCWRVSGQAKRKEKQNRSMQSFLNFHKKSGIIRTQKPAKNELELLKPAKGLRVRFWDIPVQSPKGHLILEKRDGRETSPVYFFVFSRPTPGELPGISGNGKSGNTP